MGNNVDIKECFRAGMRRLASGVSVVSTQVDGQRYAMTASSVTSVSDEPASLLVCVNRSAAMQPRLLQGQPFAVNLLSRQQQDISDHCAFGENDEGRFSIGQWGTAASGVPYLENCQASFLCTVDNDNYCYGTHQIVIGRIEEVIIADDVIDPLVYLDGQYVGIATA